VNSLSIQSTQDDDEALLMQSEEAAVEEDDLDDVGGGAGLPRMMTKRDRDRAQSKEQRELHERRMRKLEEMRLASQERAKASENLSKEARLKYIMQQVRVAAVPRFVLAPQIWAAICLQAEVFSHFLHGKSEEPAGATGSGGAAGGSAASRTSASAKRGKHAVTDRDEAEELLAEDEGAVGSSVKLSKQPSIVTGTMRDYQLEGLNWMIHLHNSNISGILADESEFWR
jgi:SNF2 family DNA or RNA helicase